MKSTSRRNFLKGASLAGFIPLIKLDAFLSDEKEALTFDKMHNINEENGKLIQTSDNEKYGNLIPAPENPAEWPDWREKLHLWRKEMCQQLNYDGSGYLAETNKWIASDFSCCFIMMSDEKFYNRQHNEYTIDSFVEEGIREFGGYDSVVLWQAYPRIGVDDRNQFDFYRDMPGGLEGVREVIQKFHIKGIKVFIDYNPWDTATRRGKKSDIDILVEMIKTIDADGLFLDTLKSGDDDFYTKLNAAKVGIGIEGEVAPPLDVLHKQQLSWAQGFMDGHVPGILRNKWFERHHMQHQIKRWMRHHIEELHMAWMNGSGMMIWENVFGQWVGWNERDKSILRSMLPIQRRYKDIFCGEGWTPLVETMQDDVFANLWEGEGLRLWTIVNRNGHIVSGDLIRTNVKKEEVVFDLISGSEAKINREYNDMIIDYTLRPFSIGCIVASNKKQLGKDFGSFLSQIQEIDKRFNPDDSFPALQNGLVNAMLPVTVGKKDIPSEMVFVPAQIGLIIRKFKFRECGYYESQSDVVMDWNVISTLKLDKSLWREVINLNFNKALNLDAYAIDITAVTNIMFFKFIKESGYKPKHAENFLKHWINGAPPAGKENHPVVWIDLYDARSYAKWAGKRLPSEDEWQCAAQRYSIQYTDERQDKMRYPWGEKMLPGRCNMGETGDTTDVKAFPEGRSPYGCYDMCGNTWEWTESERTDGRNRFCIIRGGSYYNVYESSMWYVEGGPQICQMATKFLMLWPGLDRCATIGFRCVTDVG